MTELLAIIMTIAVVALLVKSLKRHAEKYFEKDKHQQPGIYKNAAVNSQEGALRGDQFGNEFHSEEWGEGIEDERYLK